MGSHKFKRRACCAYAQTSPGGPGLIEMQMEHLHKAIWLEPSPSHLKVKSRKTLHVKYNQKKLVIWYAKSVINSNSSQQNIELHPTLCAIAPTSSKVIVFISVELLGSVESIAMLAFAWDSTELQLSPIQQEDC